MIREWVKRFGYVLLVLLLAMPSCAGASPFGEENPFLQLRQEQMILRSRRMLEGLLLRSTISFPSSKEGILIGDWFVHPDGFLVKIPDGMMAMLRFRGTEIMLVRGPDDKAAYRTSISLSSTQKDDRLKTMTWEKVTSLYADQFDRFKLIDIVRTELFGSESVNISFYAGSPQLFFKQCLFERGGKSYVVTLMSENTVKTMLDAWRLFDLFCNSLFFI